MAMLDHEAQTHRDARRLLRRFEDALAFNGRYRALELLLHFDSRDGIRARPALIAVLLQEMSLDNPVPRSLAQ